MSRIYLDQDIQSLSEFRAGVVEYEAMQEKIEL
jgi:hypothetical protein